MIVTVNTDASWSEKHQIGAYAFWIVYNGKRIKQSGLLRKKVKDPQVAEFRCIINAFHILIKEKVQRVNKVIVNTDCLNIIHLIKNDKKAIAKYGLKNYGLPELTKQFKEMVTKGGIHNSLIEFRHVKAHVTTEGARNYVNDWCDKEAKQHLRNAVSELGKTFTYLMGDNGDVSNWETKKLMKIGIKFDHEWGQYEVRNYLNDEGKEVKERSEITQVYCERIYNN